MQRTYGHKLETTKQSNHIFQIFILLEKEYLTETTCLRFFNKTIANLLPEDFKSAMEKINNDREIP